MSATLYELTEQFKQIQSMVEEDGSDEQVFLDTLDSIDWEHDFEEKADSYVMTIRNVEVSIGADEGQIEAIEKILKDLKDSKTRKENMVKRMKESLCNAMVATDHTKFKSKRFSFWTQETSSVVIDDPANIPMDFYRVREPEVNKEAIKKALNNGETFEFAHLEKKSGVRFK